MGDGHLKRDQATGDRCLGLAHSPAARFNFGQDRAGANQIPVVILIGGLPDLEGLGRTALETRFARARSGA